MEDVSNNNKNWVKHVIRRENNNDMIKILTFWTSLKKRFGKKLSSVLEKAMISCWSKKD